MVPIESFKLFRVLPPAELASLREVTREVACPAGQEIFKEGDRGDGVYLIRSGTVQITAKVVDSDRQVFARLGAGEVFGEMAALDNQPRSASATAETEASLYFLPREQLLALLDRSPQFCLALMREITHRLREFDRLYLTRVIQAERMALVGRFASSIVHDLKNPLTIISVAADMACLENATPEARRTAQGRIRKQVDRISNMVSDILDFTRGSSQPLALTVTDYAGFLREVVAEIEREIALKEVRVEYASELPAVAVAIHPPRLSRVLYNLMCNAVDAMPEGGKILLRFQVTPSEVVTEIEDTGHGIAPEVLGHLFEAFTTFGKPRGTGLGLSIAKRIIEDHHGRIAARNVPDGGALFSFTLPLAGTAAVET